MLPAWMTTAKPLGFAYALYLDRQVDEEAAQMIVEAGLIPTNDATDLLMELSCRFPNCTNRRKLNPKKNLNLLKDRYANQ